MERKSKISPLAKNMNPLDLGRGFESLGKPVSPMVYSINNMIFILWPIVYESSNL